MSFRIPVLLLSLCLLGGYCARGAGIEQLTPSNLPMFLKTFNQDLGDIDLVFDRLSTSKLPLLDEAGQPVGRRKIKDRRQTIADLKKTLADFERQPQNLVVTMTLSAQTEELADEVYDVSQIAYDNDQEELAMRLTSLLGRINDDSDLIEDYSLRLAAEKEQELQRLKHVHAASEQRLRQSSSIALVRLSA